MVKSLDTDSRRQAAALMASPEAVATEALAFAERYCADRLEGEGEVRALLQQGQPEANNYFRYGLALALARSLAHLDETARAVYLFDWENPADEMESESVGVTSALGLIVWVERSTAALTALLGELDGALTRQYRELIGPAARRLRSFLDLHIVEDREVEQRTGYAALLSSLRQRPLRVWQRQPQ